MSTLNTKNKFWKKHSEIFQDFKKKYPEIGMKQRAFENCKPFFVVPARPKDRNSCCCRQHVEIRMLFKMCMDYGRSIVSKDAERSTVFQVYDSLNKLVDEESSEDDPLVVTEHLYVISPDLRHDHHSFQGCLNNVVNYLKEIGYNIEFMHEWIDGCSAEYKSHHCIGDVSFSLLDFGFPTVHTYTHTYIHILFVKAGWFAAT